MSTMEPSIFSQAEIDSAWAHWQALLAHMETLWARYEEPFSERMLRQEEWESQGFSWPEVFSDEDIPF